MAFEKVDFVDYYCKRILNSLLSIFYIFSLKNYKNYCELLMIVFLFVSIFKAITCHWIDNELIMQNELLPLEF